MLDKFKSRIISTRGKMEDLVSDSLLVDQAKVSEEIQQRRMDTCNNCEQLYKVSNRCRLCGCFMGVKTWMKTQKCPIDKWGPGIDIQEVV